ncbi:MAG: acetoacetate decarboxylase family protein [Gordonia sp. (in: high G+C Gram-positive bacteria)]
MTTGSTHDVLGTEITMPVEIRRARCFVAAFTADATAVSAAIAAGAPDHRARLTPRRIRPGRALCMLVFVDYVDGDLGPYNEFGVCFPVVEPTAAQATTHRPLASLLAGSARALIHRLPVDGEFTLAAGRGIWGFPKILADFDVDHDSPVKHGRVSADGRLIADLTVRPGLPMPSTAATTTLHAYSQLGGVLRETPWQLSTITGARTRPGGAHLELGTHEIAHELRALGLGRRALMTSSVRHLGMTFGDAVERSE